MTDFRETQYGFEWGPVQVERIAAAERREGEGLMRVLRVNDLTIYVSPAGRRVRVFRNGTELKPERAVAS